MGVCILFEREGVLVFCFCFMRGVDRRGRTERWGVIVDLGRIRPLYKITNERKSPSTPKKKKKAGGRRKKPTNSRFKIRPKNILPSIPNPSSQIHSMRAGSAYASPSPLPPDDVWNAGGADWRYVDKSVGDHVLGLV